MKWEPIETAPRDECNVLLAEHGSVFIGYWSITFERWNGPLDAYGDREAVSPTHWMPLPEPPK